MALRLLRLRRTVTQLSFTFHRPISSLITPTAARITFQMPQQSPGFTGTRVSMMSTAGSQKQYKLYQEGDEITENTILFEGCDYNHWLITVDFPKDPKPSPEEMVATYERICAQGLNISIEEAKKKIYACSTTTYEGFQAVMTEAESEKFKDVPGVVFVLPDSYIDPGNKEYGGDKYENGVITPRPPPVQRWGERRRERNRYPPRFDQQRGPVPNQQGNPQYGQRGPMQGGPVPNQQGNIQYGQQGPMQGGPVPNQQGNLRYGQQEPMQGGPMPNQPGSSQYGQQGPVQGGPMPNQQGNWQYGQQGLMQGGGNNYRPQQNYPPQQNYVPPGPGGRMPMNNTGYAPGGRNTYQSNMSGPAPSYQDSYNQGQQASQHPPDGRSFPQGDGRDHGSGLRDYKGDSRNYSPTHAGNYAQGGNDGYGRQHPDGGQRQVEQRSVEGGNYSPTGQPGWTNQDRY